MTCKEVRELLPDLALGETPVSGETGEHLRSCAECTGKLDEFRSTMALLDEWQAPEPTPYFDTRLQARLREEKAKAPAGWLAWIRKPALALVATALVVLGATVYRSDLTTWIAPNAAVTAPPGTAVGDLQTLDSNHDMYSDFDVLDDLDVQQDATANP